MAETKKEFIKRVARENADSEAGVVSVAAGLAIAYYLGVPVDDATFAASGLIGGAGAFIGSMASKFKEKIT